MIEDHAYIGSRPEFVELISCWFSLEVKKTFHIIIFRSPSYSLFSSVQRQIKCGLNSLKNRSLRTLFRTLLGLLESVFPTSYYIETKICFTRDGLLLWYGLGRYGTPEQVKGEPVILKFV